MSSLAPPAPRWSPRSVWLMVAVWALLLTGLALVVPSLPWARTLDVVRRLNATWLVAGVACNLLVLFLWTAEWRLLVPASAGVSYGSMLRVVTASAAVHNSVPFFAGEATSVAMLIAQAGVPRDAAFTVLAMDQLLVGIGKLTVIGAAALYSPLPGSLRTAVLTLLAVILALGTVLLALAHRWTAIMDRLYARESPVVRMAAYAASLGQHLEVLRDIRRSGRAIVLALAKKGAELGAIIAVQVAFGLEPSLAAGLLVLGVLAIATILNVTPGNLGIYEATVFGAYRYLGTPAETALGLALVQHAVLLVPTLVAGAAGLLIPRPARALSGPQP